MKDKNGAEIKEGDIIKRVGKVLYADGLKEKVSKKTWVAQEVYGQLVLPTKGEGVEFLVIGNLNEGGVKEEYLPLVAEKITINGGSVAENYRVLKDIESKGWQRGDIVKIAGKVSKETLDSGVLERCDDALPNKHVLIVVEPVAINSKANEL